MKDRKERVMTEMISQGPIQSLFQRFKAEWYSRKMDRDSSGLGSPGLCHYLAVCPQEGHQTPEP